ncbi:ImmA/IrrE family metallo-endopeptidase [Laceyella tengchongensis]|nr:ImmA/IrrE family metallo-endopeptidase [Laceyella tengchongensis]
MAFFPSRFIWANKINTQSNSIANRLAAWVTCLAHEIFHCLIHVGNQLSMPVAFINLQENQARAGAAHLLMPLWMISELDFNMDSMDRIQLAHLLASTFNVSISFANERIKLIDRRIKELYINRDYMKLRRLIHL